MRKRERENPCAICGHYHKYEEGEVCGVCGHRIAMPSAAPEDSRGESPAASRTTESAFPSEIVKDSIYLGSYDNASRSELLRAIGITHVLNTVPACQNLYRNSFTYQCIADDKYLQFDEANTFLEQCEKEKARVLVHCMSGKSRSAAVVVAYLMKSRGWRLAQSFQWVKERRPQVNLQSAVQQQLVEYEQRLFGQSASPQSFAPPNSVFPSLGFGFPKPLDSVPAPVFAQQAIPLIFNGSLLNSTPVNFTFGAGTTTASSNDGMLFPFERDTHLRTDGA